MHHQLKGRQNASSPSYIQDKIVFAVFGFGI